MYIYMYIYLQGPAGRISVLYTVAPHMAGVVLHASVCVCVFVVQAERASSEKAASAAVTEERERNSKMIEDMKVIPLHVHVLP